MKKWKDTSEKTAYQYQVDDEKWVILKLKKGAVAGEHYHKGTSKLKNPEVLVQICGKAEYFFKDIKTGKSEKLLVESPNIIKIKPNIYHEMRAIEDIILLERYDESDDKFELI